MICKNCGCYISFMLDYCTGCGAPKPKVQEQSSPKCNADDLRIGDSAGAGNNYNAAYTVGISEKILVCPNRESLYEKDDLIVGRIVYVVEEKSYFLKTNSGFLKLM